MISICLLRFPSSSYGNLTTMKFLSIPLALLGGLLPLHSQENIPLKWELEIPGPVSDGTRAEPALKSEPIDFKVLTSQTQRMEVTEAPEMPDLPPIEGTINVTVQMVADPGLPDPPPPLPELPPNDPAVLARMEELRKNHRGTELVFLSATVYDHSRTLLRIYPSGKIEGEITAWSNIDFSHFCGFSLFRVKSPDGRIQDIGLLMGIGNTDTYQTRKRLARAKQGHYQEPEIPEMPDLAVGGPSFVVIEGQKDGEAMTTLIQTHELYRKEGARMEEAYLAREKAHAERHAYLLANPPKPEDIVIRFWQRDQSDRK